MQNGFFNKDNSRHCETSQMFVYSSSPQSSSQMRIIWKLKWIMWRVLEVVTTGEVIIVTRDTWQHVTHLSRHHTEHSQFVWNIMTPICSEQSSTQTANTAGGWWHVESRKARILYWKLLYHIRGTHFHVWSQMNIINRTQHTVNITVCRV